MSDKTISINATTNPGSLARQQTVGGNTKNEELIRRLYALAEQKDSKGFMDIFAEDGYFWDVSAGVKYYGDDIGKTVDIYAKAFPDMHRELFSMWAVGDRVFVELSLNGTQKGGLQLPFGEIKPTNKKMSTPCFDSFRISNGKITQFHCYTAATQLLGQIGVIENVGAALSRS